MIPAGPETSTVAWALVVGVTGVLNTLSTPLFGLWRAQAMPPLLAPFRGQPPLERPGSVQAAVESVRRRMPEVELISVVAPNSRIGSPRHSLVWTRGATPLTQRLFTPILVDAASGQLTGTSGRALQVSRPLHFGDDGGLPLKIIWALLDVVTIGVLVSGAYLFLARGGGPVEVRIAEIGPGGSRTPGTAPPP